MTIKEQQNFVAQKFHEQLLRVCDALDIPSNARETFVAFYLVKQGLGWMLEAYADNERLSDEQYRVIQEVKETLDNVLFEYKEATFYPDDFTIPDDMVN